MVLSRDSPAQPATSPKALHSCSNNEVEGIIDGVFGPSLLYPSPRRFAMGDLVRVDSATMSMLKSSSRWKTSLSHIERVVLSENEAVAEEFDFVARAFRQRSGVVYAVRYWEGLADVDALTVALNGIREAWFTSTGQADSDFGSNNSTTGSKHHRFDDREGRYTTDTTSHADLQLVHRIGNKQLPTSKRDRKDFPTTPGSVDITKRNTTPVEIPKGSTYLREDDNVSGLARSKQSSLVRVLGFAVELDYSTKKASAALVAEWPGVGSLHDFLSGKVQVARESFQDDLLRWTRQVAEGLATVSRRLGGGGVDDSGGHMLWVSARNTFLFPRPRDEFQGEQDVFDIKMATFVRGCSIPGDAKHHKDAGKSWRYLMPPELLWAKGTDATLENGRKKNSIKREAADVWALGILVFELATGRVAGPTPLALRPLRDILRDVPLGPRFIYGDVARGVIRLALKRDPAERARVGQLETVVEEISTRTLQRAHVERDRQNRLRLMRCREAAGETETTERDGATDDGYGEALTQWRINEAVERAGGRAKAFLRRMWFNSLTEDDKRRIRHKRRHRKANKEAREWRARRVRAAKMHHWTPVDVARWISHLLRQAEASRKLRPLYSEGAEGGAASGTRGSKYDENRADGALEPSGDGTGIANNDATKEEIEAMAAVKGPTRSEEQAPTPARDTPDENLPFVKQAENPPSGGRGGTKSVTALIGNGGMGIKHLGKTRDISSIADDGNDEDDEDDEDDEGGEDDEDDNGGESGEDDHSNGFEGSRDSEGWTDEEAGERTGYAAVEVESFAVKRHINGSCIVKAMEDALEHSEDALTRFVKSSIRLARPAEVEAKRVELIVRELLTVRPYSTPIQLKIRALAVAIVRGAEAPRVLTEFEVNAQLLSVAKVLTAGYRRQVDILALETQLLFSKQASMVEQGLGLAAARIQGLARGKHIRRVVSLIWLEAEEHARNVVRGERLARMEKEKEKRAKEKEEALQREKEEAIRYRLRLVPRVSSVTCRSMVVSLPLFLVEAARGANRFLVVETTVVPPPSSPSPPPPPLSSLLSPPSLSYEQQPSSPHQPIQALNNGTETDADESGTFVVANTSNHRRVSSNNNIDDGGNGWRESCETDHGHIRVLLRQGAEIELKVPMDDVPIDDGYTVPQTRAASAMTEETGEAEAAGNTQPGKVNLSSTERQEAQEGTLPGAKKFLHAVGKGLPLSGLRPCTTYRLTLEMPVTIREELLESARSLGVVEAVRSLEMPANAEANEGDHVIGRGKDAVFSTVETLPDVPDKVPLVKCKVLTSASAVDPRDPSGVLSLRQWQSPYPGVANMDGPSSDDYDVLAPGRPEPLVFLQWKEPDRNGLNICSCTVERRVGRTGGWKKIIVRGNGGKSNSKRRDGETQGDQRSPTDAVDAPLRTIPVDSLRKVALQGLPLAYRVYAENVLGAGAPSNVQDIDVRAFLGHLRAQEVQDAGHATSSSQSRSRQRGSTALPVQTPFSGAAVTDIDASSFSKSSLCKIAGRQQEQDSCSQKQRKELSDGREGEKRWAKPLVCQTKRDCSSSDSNVLSPPSSAFVGNFMGLDGFGEARVHKLFAPPSRHHRNSFRAPAEGLVRSGENSTDRGGVFTLPPVVLASGFSGENRGVHATPEKYTSGYIGNNYENRERLDGDNGVVREGDRFDLHESRSGGKGLANNDVFHAFINLGRRLPGRLRREGDGS